MRSITKILFFLHISLLSQKTILATDCQYTYKKHPTRNFINATLKKTTIFLGFFQFGQVDTYQPSEVEVVVNTAQQDNPRPSFEEMIETNPKNDLLNLIDTGEISFEQSLEKKNELTTWDPTLRKLNIFSQDDRTISYNKYPETSVGALFFKREKGYYQCTGTLISKNHILTNAHCVFSTQEKTQLNYISKLWKDSFQFYPNYRKDSKNKNSASWKRIYYSKEYKQGTPEGLSQEDWAIIELSRPLGQQYGWMKVKGYKLDDYIINEQINPVNLIGYSGDKYRDNPGAHYSCTIRGVVHFLSQNKAVKSVMHDCDSTKGSSGGPLYHLDNDNQAKIVALNFASFVLQNPQNFYVDEFSPHYANLAIATWKIAEFIRHNLVHNISSNTTIPEEDSDPSTSIKEIIFLSLSSAIGAMSLYFLISKAINSCKKIKPNLTTKLEQSNNTDIENIEVEVQVL